MVLNPSRLADTLRRRARYDVVFYAPAVGSIISSADTLPPGGAETQILMLAKELTSLGLRVAVVAFGKPDELPRSVGGFDVVPRPPYRKRLRLIGKLVEILVIWRSLWHAPARVVVVRGAGINLGIVGVFARLTGQRLIYASANVIDFDPGRILHKRRDRSLHDLGVRLADAIVVQTDEQSELCRAAYGRTATVVKSIAPIPPSQPLSPKAFLWVGRLVSYKQPLAYIALARDLPEATFWMIGVPTPHHPGDEAIAARVIAQSAQVPNLELVPPRPHAAVGALMSQAVASVNTADYEGMPNVLLEAWSRGVPALVLTHDPDGAITRYGLGAFANGSPATLVELAREQWLKRHDRETISHRCRDYVAKHHAPQAVARAWASLIAPDAITGQAAATSERPNTTCAA